MDNFIFMIVVMVLLMICGAATHRADIVMIEVVWMGVWVVFAAIYTEAALKFSPLAALGAYLVLLLLPDLTKDI